LVDTLTPPPPPLQVSPLAVTALLAPLYYMSGETD
jgi:hypothetical protein